MLVKPAQGLLSPLAFFISAKNIKHISSYKASNFPRRPEHITMAAIIRGQGLTPYSKPQLTQLDRQLLTLGFLDSKAQQQPTKKPRTTFLTLPSEIRNKIYSLISQQCSVETLGWTSPLTLPARFAQACQQIRTEYLPIYHRHRRIHLTLPRGARRVSSETRDWLAVFGTSRLPITETVSIYSNRSACTLRFRGGGYEVETMLFRRMEWSISGFDAGSSFVPGRMLQKAMEEVIELEAEVGEDGSPFLTEKLVSLLVKVLARSGGKRDNLE